MKSNADTQTFRPIPRRPRGLTLAELILATAILSLVGLAIAGMTYAHFRDSYHQTEVRHATVSQDVAAKRLETAIRDSQMILANGSNFIVLWLADRTAGTNPTLSDLCRIELNTTTNTLYCYKAATNLSTANNFQCTLTTTNFDSVTAAMKSDGNFPGTAWGSGITSFTTSLDGNAQQARRVTYQIAVTKSDVSETAVGTVALRLR
jgi:Tfp pilus assembly protein PilE